MLSERALASKAPLPNQGLVKEVLQTSAYTYVFVSSSKGTAWLAGPKIDVKVGDTVSFPEGVNMPNFRSSELKRNFPQVIFVGDIRKEETGGAAQPQTQTQPQSGGSGDNIVKEVLQTSLYTYLNVTRGSGTVWIAAPKLDIKVGQAIRFPAGATMTNFQSKELNRNFPTVIFVGQVRKVGTAGGSQSQQKAKPPSGGNVVKEVLQTSLYTYLNVTQGNGTVWLAAPKLEIKVGEKIRFPAGTTITNFTSKELRRTFPKVIFLGQVQKVQ
jgi:mannose-6-phosphate isomerase-like protein (cupin superfamily)